MDFCGVRKLLSQARIKAVCVFKSRATAGMTLCGLAPLDP